MKRGFSLLEVMLALAILIALLSALGQFAWSVGRSQERLTNRATRQAGIDAVIDRLTVVLDTASVTVQGSSGFVGSNTEIRSFVAQDRPDTSISSGLAAMRPFHVQFDESERTLKLDAGIPLSLGDLRIRYHNGTNWLDSYDSLEQEALPRAVLVEAWMDPSLRDHSDSGHPPDRRAVLSPSGVWRAEE